MLKSAVLDYVTVQTAQEPLEHTQTSMKQANSWASFCLTLGQKYLGKQEE